jgi:hypothetical protein
MSVSEARRPSAGTTNSNNPTECRSKPVKQKLEDVRAEKLKDAGHIQSDPGYEPNFFPEDVIQEVLCEDTIRKILRCNCKDCGVHTTFLPEGCSWDRTVYCQAIINRKARGLLALLVVMDHPALIGGFLQHRSAHVDTILTGHLDCEALKKHLPNIETKRTETEVKMFFNSFLTERLRFSPPTFITNWYEPLDPEDVLPFINTTKIGSGGYGNVYSFQFYPGYLKWEEFKNSVDSPDPARDVVEVLTCINDSPRRNSL